MSKQSPERERNQLLRKLAVRYYARLEPNLKPVTFEINRVLYEARSPIELVYFPLDCVLSAIAVMENGDGIEVGTIGHEGFGGVTSFLAPCSSTNRVIVQVAGDALVMEAATLATEAKASPAISELLLRHHQAFLTQVTQSVACNGLHSLAKRCCRWLLMTHDRIAKDELPLTHEFLSLMLAVRRPGVTQAINALEKQGLVESKRGTIRILDRAGLEAASCECYGIIVNEYQRLLG
jgi:CRP-like cAMP-binding protein